MSETTREREDGMSSSKRQRRDSDNNDRGSSQRQRLSGSRDRRHHERDHSWPRGDSSGKSRGYRSEERRRDDNRDSSNGRCFSKANSSDWEEPYRDEWNCFECQSWNVIRHTSCGRCGQQRPCRRSEIRARGRECSVNENSEVDEFGRKRDADSQTKPKGRRWPPAFDRRSAAYVFDARSAMFYHTASQFFYDPKTKLYYDTKLKTFLQHLPGENPPFKVFKPEGDSKSDLALEDEQKAPEKKLIAISLKTKVLSGKSKEPKKDSRMPPPSETTKSRAQTAEMEKWSERGREIRGKEQVVRTKSGLPVCLLCKRKFSDLAKLARHDNQSDMHKNNLIKYGRNKKIEDELAEAHYRDRALERRALHGVEAAAATPLGVDHGDGHGNANRPADNLGASNVGNQMLQKLGWVAGSSLGGRTHANGDNPLEKEWERIEQLAKGDRR